MRHRLRSLTSASGAPSIHISAGGYNILPAAPLHQPCAPTMQPSGVMMGRIKLQPRVIAALLSAGATEKIIADAHQILDACITRIGRPRKYRNRAECDLAYRERRKLREKGSVFSKGRDFGAWLGRRLISRWPTFAHSAFTSDSGMKTELFGVRRQANRWGQVQLDCRIRVMRLASSG